VTEHGKHIVGKPCKLCNENGRQETIPLCSHDHVCNALAYNTTPKSNTSIHYTLEIEMSSSNETLIETSHNLVDQKNNLAFITLKKYVPSLCCTENLHPGLSASNTLHKVSKKKISENLFQTLKTKKQLGYEKPDFHVILDRQSLHIYIYSISIYIYIRNTKILTPKTRPF